MEDTEVIRINNLRIVFKNDRSTVTAVDDISFSIKKGETLALVGESGSGKSVTAMSIMGLLPFPLGRVAGGTAFFDSRDIFQLPPEQINRIRGKEISMIFQEPMTSLNPVHKCGKQVVEVLRYHIGMKAALARQKALELFRQVQLPSPEIIYESYPHQISGGQKQRVMIAMAAACNPKLIIADEPTTALDVTVQKSILLLLKKIQKEHGTSILFITHDLGLVPGFADKIAVMYRGKIVEQGETSSIFKNPVHPYTKGLLNCRPPMEQRPKKLPVIEDFLKGNDLAADIITKEEREQKHRLIYNKQPIMKVRNLSTFFYDKVSFLGSKKTIYKAVDNVGFEVYAGETLGIVGESGCGKTTLGRTILQLIKASSGTVEFQGRDLTDMGREEIRRLRKDIQIVFQDPYSSLNPRIMVGEAILEAMKVHHQSNQKDNRHLALEILEKVGLEESSFYKYPHEFSGGQRQRICIARALILRPKLIICDESVSALDVSVQAQVLNLLNDLKTEFGLTYIFISHDLSVVRYMSDRIIVMKNGRFEEIGEADYLFQHPEKEYTKKLLNSIPN